tara:strand:- start:302 stop:823 length:522 start_codon:yes stop_codon:yes gene_type:complete
VEYPNLRYLSRLSYQRGDVGNSFEVVLLLNPELMTADDVLFCQVNAAEAAGRRIRPGLAAFEDMFAPEVKTNPAYGQSQTIRRETLHPDSCPTYIQAEVLIPGPIKAEHIGAVVVKRDDDGRAAKLSLKSSSTKGKPVHVIPDFFDLNAVQHEVFDNGRAIKISTKYGDNRRG